jgi:hypothetical protein
LPGCKVDDKASPQFNRLRKQWRCGGYPQIDKDLKQAFEAISENILAKKARRVQAGSNVVCYKYRQNSSDIRRGENYGWRIYALYDVMTATLYPIIVYPKQAWDNADTATILAAIREIRTILGYCVSSGCDGRMGPVEPIEKRQEGNMCHVKTQCGKCGTVHWKPDYV